MYAVIKAHSFDPEASVVLFTSIVLFKDDEYDKAKAYLHWSWEDYYNREIAKGSSLSEDECRHWDQYAQVVWEDGTYTEFILTSSSEPDAEFNDVDWKRYL